MRVSCDIRALGIRSLMHCMGIAFAITGCADTGVRTDDGLQSNGPPRLIADRFYYDSAKSPVVGAELGAKFDSSQDMEALLSLGRRIGDWDGREWRLLDVLVYMSCNANGDVATWWVAGPKDVVEPYIIEMRERARLKQSIYDWSDKAWVFSFSVD